MSYQEADQLPYTRCLHGKRPCHQLDVNRRCIQSVTAAMTDDSKEIFFYFNTKHKRYLITIHEYQCIQASYKTNISCVRFKLPNNDIVLPTDTKNFKMNDNSELTNTDIIEEKLLLHPHTDLLCIVNSIFTNNNKFTRNGQHTTYIIPPLLSVITNRLLNFYEDHAKSTHNHPIFSPYMSSLTSSRQEEYNSCFMNTRLINEYFTGNPAIGYALGLKTDTITNLVPKTYRQAMKSAESAQC